MVVGMSGLPLEGERTYAVFPPTHIRTWCNGNTVDFDSTILGSTPSVLAIAE